MAFGGVTGPVGGGVPLGAVAGGVDMDGDEDNVGFAEGGAVDVDAADAFFEGDVFGFGDEELPLAWSWRRVWSAISLL